MVKSGLEKNYFEMCPFKKNCPEWLSWPGRLAGISVGARGTSKTFEPKMVI